MPPIPDPDTATPVVAWRGVIPAFITTTAGMLPGFLLAAFAVQLREDIRLTLTDLGLLIGVFFGTAAVFSPMLGRLSESIGWAKALRLAALLSAVSLAGMGWLAESAAVLAFFFVVGGIASSLGQIASNLTVARCVDVTRQGLVFGLRHASVPAAAFLAGLAVPTVALTVGWRWGFRGAILIAVAAIVSIPREEQRHVINPAPPRETNTPAEPRTPLRLLVLLAIAVGLGTGGGDTLGTFVVSYAVEKGVAENSAGVLLAIGSLCGVTARIIAGWLIDRVSHADLTAVAAMIGIAALGTVVLNIATEPVFFVGALVAFTAGWGWAGLFTFAVVRANPEAPATASGITQTGKYFGAALGPPIFGAIADRVSFSAAWWFTTAALVCAAALMIYVRNQRPQ